MKIQCKARQATARVQAATRHRTLPRDADSELVYVGVVHQRGFLFKIFCPAHPSTFVSSVLCQSFSRWKRPVTFPRNSFMISCHLYLGLPRDRISLSSQLFTVLFHRWPLVDVIFSAQFHIFLRCKIVQHSIFWSCMSFTTLDVSASIQST